MLDDLPLFEPTVTRTRERKIAGFRCTYVDVHGKQCDDVRATQHGAWMHHQRSHVGNWSTKCVPVMGALDAGERELLRKRLLYTIGELSVTLRRTPKAVIDSAVLLADDRFERSHRRVARR